ncbi:MAG TPA: LacI family DNA-binding transcriptional regulator [Prolixibacteraceae bacterium]|nr:LacI family DNA-binding transcriptional regulator [Prolixibacteraceae bacterium]
MGKEATIYDIANELNLSASTVSRALKGNRHINSETRKRVEKCAKKMHYRSNSFASNLRTQRTHTIGIIVPRLDSSFMSTCLAGMEEVANENGYNVIISQSHESSKKEEQNAKTMFNNRVDGVIVSMTVEKNKVSYFSRFDEKNVPVVYFDRVPDDSISTCFVIDNSKVAYDATSHLIGQSCRNLLHVTLKSNSNVYRDRIDGFELAVAGHEECVGRVFYVKSLTLEEGQVIADEIIKMEPMPDGVFVANDQAAAGCLLRLQELGVRVPGDIAIVGFNDEPISKIVSPKLTTVHYPGREAGIMAAKNLIENLNGDESFNYTKKVVLNARLVIRESSKKSEKKVKSDI